MTIVVRAGNRGTGIQALTRWIPSRSVWIRIRSCRVISAGCIPHEICSGEPPDSQFGSRLVACMTWTYMLVRDSWVMVNFGWISTPFSTDFEGPNWSVIDAPRHRGGGGAAETTCQGPQSPGGTLQLSDDLDILFLQVPISHLAGAPAGRRGSRTTHGPRSDLWGSQPPWSQQIVPPATLEGPHANRRGAARPLEGNRFPSPAFVFQFGNIRALFFR
jgi:hypothetical protein